MLNQVIVQRYIRTAVRWGSSRVGVAGEASPKVLLRCSGMDEYAESTLIARESEVSQ